MSEKKLTKDIISQLKNTDEYKRSQAIAGCITFLSNKIKELELNNNNLNKKIEDLNKKNTSESELNFKLKSEIKVLKKQSELYKTKLSVTEELNKTLEKTVSELKNKINNDKIFYNQKNEKLSSSINKYKNIIEEIKSEKEKEINILIKEKTEIYNEKENILNELNKTKKIEELNKQLKHKMKKYEVLLYKMDLENQGYKDEIQKYQNQLSTLTGQTINFIPIYKIDLNTELDSIQNNNNIDNDNNSNEENIDNNKEEENIETNIDDKNEIIENNNDINNKEDNNNEKYINTEDINYHGNNNKNNSDNSNENSENDEGNNSKDNEEDIQDFNKNK